MSADLQTLLRPLREVEPTSDELARVRAAIGDEQNGDDLPPRPAFFGRRPLALLAATSLAIAVAVVTLPSGETRPVRCAARCRPQPQPRPRRPWASRRSPATGTSSSASATKCPARSRASTAARCGSTRSGVASSASTCQTMPLAVHDGPFGQAPLATLPTDPDALLRALNAAYDDGSFAAHGAASAQQPKSDANVRRAEMTMFTSCADRRVQRHAQAAGGPLRRPRAPRRRQGPRHRSRRRGPRRSRARGLPGAARCPTVSAGRRRCG